MFLMLELRFPDGGRRLLEDDDARLLADRLWEMADGARTASIAAAIQRELGRESLLRLPIDVPEVNAGRVTEALTLH
jgi:hypothetical protein